MILEPRTIAIATAGINLSFADFEIVALKSYTPVVDTISEADFLYPRNYLTFRFLPEDLGENIIVKDMPFTFEDKASSYSAKVKVIPDLNYSGWNSFKAVVDAIEGI
ncbi:MAG: hypothetical protein ACREVA_02260 [Burkholderiales bacterium]